MECNKSLETVNSNLGKAEQAEQAAAALEKAKADSEAAAKKLDELSAALLRAKSREEDAEKLAKAAAALEALFSQYDARDALQKTLEEDGALLEEEQRAKEEDQTALKAQTDRVEALKKEKSALEDAGEQKERLLRERGNAEKTEDELKRAAQSVSAYELLTEKLAQAQKAYLAAQENADAAGRDYDAKNRAYLSEQAGILAQTLKDGAPCPVCGSRDHPLPAALSETAPTEAELKKAKANADGKRQLAADASTAAGELRGQVDTNAAQLRALAEKLSMSPEPAGLKRETEKRLDTIREEIRRLTEAAAIEEKRAARKKELEELIPKEEEKRARLDQSIRARSETITMLSALRPQTFFIS